MSGNIELIPFGGTLLMKDQGEGYVPHYTPEDVALYGVLKSYSSPHAKEGIRILLEKGAEGHDEITKECGHLFGKSGTARARANEALMDLGYQLRMGHLPYGPIDSINFNVDMHYEALRNAVLACIRRGDVPVIAGGTDTLKYYGSILAADMRQLETNGIIPHLPPIIIASSMHAFADNPEHVYQIFRAARVAADEAVIESKNGVFALVPESETVSVAKLLPLEQPVDKLSGTLTKAFVGKGDGMTIRPDKPTPGKVIPNYDERGRGNEKIPEKLPFTHRLVAPPLEACNSAEAVLQLLHQVETQHDTKPFDAVILKGPFNASWLPQVKSLCEQIATLREKGVDVFLVNEPGLIKGKFKFHRDSPMYQNGNYTPTDPFDGFAADKALRPKLKELVSAGAILAPEMTSAQVFSRALLLDGEGKPAYFTEERAAAESKARAYQEAHAADAKGSMVRLGKPVPAIAIEYVPDANAYAQSLDLIEANKTKQVISVNCTDGAMAEEHAETLRAHPYLNVTCTFKYAGVHYPGEEAPETATLRTYGPARIIAAEPNANAGGDVSPTDIMKELSRSRG